MSTTLSITIVLHWHGKLLIFLVIITLISRSPLSTSKFIQGILININKQPVQSFRVFILGIIDWKTKLNFLQHCLSCWWFYITFGTRTDNILIKRRGCWHGIRSAKSVLNPYADKFFKNGSGSILVFKDQPLKSLS